MDIRTREAIRYLGYGRNTVDEKTLQMIQESFDELQQLAETKFIYRIFELSALDDDRLMIGNKTILSKNLRKNLQGCKEVVLFGATLGMGVDRQIRKYELLDMARAVVLQACAAAYLEEYCDRMQEEIGEIMQKDGRYLRPRFSPGYGDFSILHQEDVLNMLDAPKRIGLTMTDGFMLTPTKSVTAIIGISKTKEPCHRKGCEACDKLDCAYRRSEICYEKN